MASGSCRFSTSGKNNRLFKINATATFMGSAFEIGSLVRDYISLKHIWDSIMMEKLGTMSVPGERLHQSVLIPWNESNTDIGFDSDEGGVVEEEENDEDGLDGLSDVNKDRVAGEEVLGDPVGSDSEGEQPNRGTFFKVSESGRIVLQVGQLFRNVNEFRQVILDFSIQEGFRLKRVKNERSKMTCGCEVEGCPWRVHGSPTYDSVTYMLKTLNNVHTCLSVPKNKDVSARWVGKKFESIIKDNPEVNVRVLQSIVLRKYGVEVPDYTLHRAKKFALARGEVDHIESYNKLYKYRHIIKERNPGSCVKLSTICYDPNTNIPAHFNRFFLSFHAQKMGYLEGCREFEVVDGVPYKHAMACITKVRVDVENYVHDYLKKSTYLRTYSHYIHAIPDESLWPEVESETILPPKKRRSAGRPRLSRQRGAIEPAKVKRSVGFRCSKCKQVGHNSRTCLTYKTGGTSNVISARGRQRKRSRKGGVAAETSTAAVCSSTPTVTRVLWFPSNQQGTSSQGNANNEYFAS